MTPSDPKLEAAIRAALDAGTTPDLPADFAQRTAARAVRAAAPPQRQPRRAGWRWWLAPAAAAILLAGVRLRRFEHRGGAEPADRYAAAERGASPRNAARQARVRELRYAVAVTQHEIAEITGTAVRHAMQNTPHSPGRNQL